MVTLENQKQSEETLEAVGHFLDAFSRRDVEQLVSTMTDDCVYEDTDPRPNGQRYEGRSVVAAFFGEMFASSPDSIVDKEEIFACEDRCILLWNHRWQRNGVEGNNRGVDIFRVRDGKVAEKLAYTKNG